MNINRLWLFSPFYDIPGDGGGGGGEMSDNGNATLDAPAEPTVIEIPDENALIKVKGSDKPVKYGEHIKGFQSQFTKASQRAAALQRELEQERAARMQYERERQLASQRGQSNGQGQDIFAAIEALPYLDGQKAAEVVRGIHQEFRNRDMILAATMKELQKMRQVVGQLNETHTNQSFESKINGWLDEGGYPREYANLAKEIYLAYEGDDLDQEFPTIFAERVSEIERAFEAKRQAALNRNRQNRFVPGKGGNAGPKSPLQFKGGESAKDIAEALWSDLHPSET